MQNRYLRTIGLAGASLAALAAASSASAQDSAPQANSSVGLEEIVVTAQKRSESVNSVPLSITAVSGDDLARIGVKSTDDLVKIVPALTVAKSQSNTPIYTLRGVGFQSQNLTSTSPVGVYVDEVAYAYPYMASDVAFDLERVEVLKGPQGTLFGRSTTGGVVNYIIAKPSQVPGGSISLEYGNYDSYGVQGHVTGPITGTLSYRIAGKVELSQDGWQRSVTRPGDTLGKKNRKAVRGSLLWEPSSDFDALLSLSYWEDQSDTQAPQAIAYEPGNPMFYDPRVAASLIPGVNNARDADWTPYDYQPTASRQRPPFKADGRFYGGSLRMNYQLSDEIELTSLTGYGNVRRNDATSVDGTATEILTNVNLGSIKSFSQELRLSGDTGSIKWLIGGNYSHDKLRENIRPYTYDASAAVGIRVLSTLLKVDPALVAGMLGVPEPYIPGFIALAQYNTDPYTVPQLMDGFHTNDFGLASTAKTWAIFANGEITLSDQFAVNLGARYTKNTTSNTGCVFEFDGLTPSFAPFAGTIILQQPVRVAPNSCLTLKDDFSGFSGPVSGKLSEDNVSFRAALNWTPRPGMLGYASFSRGYKAGGFPALPANVASQLDPVTQERLDAYEVGLKASLLDRRVQMNLAGFYYDYTDKQVYGKIPDIIFGTLNRLMNVPKSEVYGAEADISALVAEGLRLRLAATYVHSEIKEFDAYDNTGAPRDYAGAALTYTPKWSVVGAVDYTRPINDDLTFTFNLSGNYQSSASGRFIGGEATPEQAAEDALFRIKPRTIFDTTVGIGTESWKLEGFVRNIFDTYYWTTADSQLDTVFRFAGMPRTYGARVTFNF